MYVEEIRAPGALTAEFAEELALSAAAYTSRITVAVGGHAVNLPVLPWCWTDLAISAGTRVTITAEGGNRPPDLEDRRALEAVAGWFRGMAGA